MITALSLFASLRSDVESKLKENANFTEEDVLTQFKDSATVKAATDAMAMATASNAFEVPMTDSNRILLERISLSPGENHSFLAFEKSPAWPTNNTKIRTRPLVTMDGKNYCPNSVLLLRQRADILESLIRDIDKNYYDRRFSEVRGDVTERLALDHFRTLLPGANVFPNAYYTIEENGKTKRCECDALIVFQDRLFIIEVKAGSFSEASMRGASRRLKNDITHLVGEPYSQALRTLSYLDENPIAHFESKDGTKLVTLEKTAFRRQYIVNVTLSDISHITSRMNSVAAMGILGPGDWPWSVHLNDLRVVSELIESPAEFLLYLHRRLELNRQPAVYTVDELDYLGMFFKDGLYFEKDELKGLSRLSIGSGGYTVDIDRYYDRLAGRVSSGEKPQLNISSWYRRFCRLIETSSANSSSYVAETLLSIAGDQQEKIERFAKDASLDIAVTGKKRTLTFLSKDNLPTLVLCVATGSLAEQVNDHSEYCETKRLQVQKQSLIFVALDGVKPQAAIFKIFEGPFCDGPRAQRKLKEFQEVNYNDYVALHGKPGRNQLCPCNSGRKAKKCCLGQNF